MKLYKAETSVFRQDGRAFLLDIRRSKCFALSPVEEEIIAAADGTPLHTLRRTLQARYPQEAIEEGLKRLLQQDVLLTQPLRPPDRPAFPCQPLRVLTLNVSQNCNLRCRYCLVQQGSYGKPPQMMEEQVARQAIDFLLRKSGESSTLRLNFFGGEPLMNYKVIRRVIPYAEAEAARQGKRIEFWLYTNAILLDEKKIAFLKAHQVNVQVSLDGPPEVHDRMRPTVSGKGSYAITTAHLSQLITGYAEHVILRATLTPHYLDTLDVLAHLAHFGTKRISLEIVCGSNGDCLFDAASRERLKEEYTRLARHVLAHSPEGDLTAVDPFIKYLFHFCTGRPRYLFCGAGTSLLGVSASGDIYLCHNLAELPAYCLGHVASGLNRVALARCVFWHDVHEKQPCRECWARYICGGGCLWEANASHGVPDRPDEGSCDLIRHTIQLSIWIYLELKEKHPEVFVRLLSQSVATWDV